LLKKSVLGKTVNELNVRLADHINKPNEKWAKSKKLQEVQRHPKFTREKFPVVTIVSGVSKKETLLVENALIYWFPLMFGANKLQQEKCERQPPCTQAEIECDAFGKY